tara:strand:+ start:31336 stop:32655 length:1320 start_codon:yes stop_codon:yes gene_type:complete
LKRKSLNDFASESKFLLANTLYGLIVTIIWPLFFIRLWLRSSSAPAYRQRWLERCGFIRPQVPGGIHLHAVSVGEVIAAEPLIKQLRSDYPERPLILTTTTPTGSERAKNLFGDDVYHCYAPFDWLPFVYQFFIQVKPALCIVMETELWPSMLFMCRRQAIPVVIANARLSDKSKQGYLRINWLVAAMLRDVHIAAQYAVDADNFLALGAQTQLLQVTGSIKFDIKISQSLTVEAGSMRQSLLDNGTQFIWLAASTHAGEDESILQAHQTLLQDNAETLLILAPRHPERCDKVAELIEQYQLTYQRSSLTSTSDCGAQILLIDSIGQLIKFYGTADLAFIGGSIVPHGGHNPIEPAAWGMPILAGPHLFNFSHVSQLLQNAGALQLVNKTEELAQDVRYYIEYPSQREVAAQAGRQVVASNQGALQRLLVLIDPLLRRY